MAPVPYHPLRRIAGTSDKDDTIDERIAQVPLKAYLERVGISLASFEELQHAMEGTLVTPLSGPAYTDGRVRDTAFDRYPLIIAYCQDAADVVLCILFAASHKIKVCARCGGHSTAGYSVLTDGLVIDVSKINGIFIDPDAMTCTVGAGVTWAALDHALNAFGLHVPGASCPSVGVTGYSLGGGYGYTSMRCGLGSDNIAQVRVVTSSGDIVTANEAQNSDLYWAHRGGTGGNFGVVVEITYNLHKLKMVWPISINWDIEHAADVMHTWQQCMTKTLSDWSLGMLGYLAIRQEMKTNPDGCIVPVNIPYFAVRGLYSRQCWGDGEKALQPLLNIGNPHFPKGPLGKRQVSYDRIDDYLLENVEDVIHSTAKVTVRCAYIKKPLSQKQYQQIVDFFKTSPNTYNILAFEPFGGAINEVAPDSTAFVHRDAYFGTFIESFWSGDVEGGKKTAVKWLKDFYDSDEMAPLWSKSYYQNCPNSDYEDWQNGYFGSNYQRLREVKTKWDPKNFFNFEQSIELL